MVSEQLQKKIDKSIKLLKLYDNPAEPVEIAYSGGKDSDVILQLAKESGINFKAIYKNTTIDPPGTLKHVRDMGVDVLQPRDGMNFGKLIAKAGMPNRYVRHCCKALKEYKVLDKAVMGVRREESRKRAQRYKEPTECRFYGSKKDHVEAIYPILDWTLEDVTEFIIDRGITLAPVYYDNEGNLHTERRLGCMCCPLQSRNKRIAAFKQYPNMLRLYARNLQKFYDTHQESVSYKCNRGDIYAQLVRDIFYPDNSQGWKMIDGDALFDRPDYKKMLEDYFGIKF